MLGGELFRNLPEPELRRLVAIATRRRFGDNEVVFHRGDPADTLHLIVHGRFAARVDSNLGDSVTVSVHGPGDAFGELALLDLEQHRSTTVAALEPGETYAVQREDFTRLRQEYPSVHEVLARLLAARVRRISDLYAEALFLDAETRVLRRLHELASLYGKGAAGHGHPAVAAGDRRARRDVSGDGEPGAAGRGSARSRRTAPRPDEHRRSCRARAARGRLRRALTAESPLIVLRFL